MQRTAQIRTPSFRSSDSSSLQITRNIALGLALDAGVVVRHGPRVGLAVVLKHAVLYWSMVLLAGVVQPDAIFCGLF